MFKRVPIETKNEILGKVKNGQSVLDAAKQSLCVGYNILFIK